MIRFFELLTALILVAVFYVVVGAFLPDQRYVERAAETNHPIRQVYDTLNGFGRFAEWHPLRMHDPRIVYSTEGEPRGVGAKLNYVSQLPSVGSGSWTIVDSVQDEYVVYEVENSTYGENKRARFDLTDKGKLVDIKWSYSVDYGWDLRGRYAGMYVSRNVGDDIQAGLANLVGLIATMPNFDYKALEIAETMVEPQHLLFVATTSDRNITAVENAMVTALEAVRKAAADNKLEVAGPARLITTNFGSEKYEFDVALPVRRPLAEDDATTTDAPAETEDAADAGVDTVTAALAEAGLPPPMPVLEPLEGLNLPENVLQAPGYSGRAVRAVYKGHPAALPLVRDMLRSYASAHGEAIHDRAFEEYLSDIDSTAAEDAEFNVYWPVK
ncbi:MAG: SRPBCC family protein [Lysobacteraceae bacterium]